MKEPYVYRNVRSFAGKETNTIKGWRERESESWMENKRRDSEKGDESMAGFGAN